MSVPRSCSGGLLGSDNLRLDDTPGIVYFATCTLPFLGSHYVLVFLLYSFCVTRR